MIDGDMKLLGDDPVYVNEKDISEITSRFDTYYERMVALAVLCYGKAYADPSGKFKISKRMLGQWLNFNQKTIKKYMDSLINLGFMRLYEEGGLSSWYNKTVVSQLNIYELLIPVTNTGEHKLVDNNIADLYSRIFSEHEGEPEVWTSIPGYRGWYTLSSSGRVEVGEREMNGRIFPAKILRPFRSSSGKIYYNLYDENGRQKKVSLDKLKLAISEK